MELLFSATLLGAHFIPGGDITEMIRKDRAALQGTWKVFLAEDNGERVPADDVKNLFLIFKGDSILIREGGKTDEKFTFLLDPGKSPRAIDMTFKAGPNKGKTDRAIYEIDGDTLRICIQSNKDAPRPREFVTRPMSNLSLVVLRRTKE